MKKTMMTIEVRRNDGRTPMLKQDDVARERVMVALMQLFGPDCTFKYVYRTDYRDDTPRLSRKHQLTERGRKLGNWILAILSLLSVGFLAVVGLWLLGRL
jgi:hypothetical protein